MKLKTLNAVLALICTALALDHTIFYTLWLLSDRSSSGDPTMPFAFAVCVVLHAVLSLFILFRSHDSRTVRYKKSNGRLIVQRVSGAGMLVLLPVHILGAQNDFRPPVVQELIHVLFFAAVLAHLSLSCSKALITLGIGTARILRIVDLALAVVCTALLAAALLGLPF